jgi:hypothetical protein
MGINSVGAFIELFLSRYVKYVACYNVLHVLIGNYLIKRYLCIVSKHAAQRGRFGLIIVTYKLF